MAGIAIKHYNPTLEGALGQGAVPALFGAKAMTGKIAENTGIHP